MSLRTLAILAVLASATTACVTSPKPPTPIFVDGDEIEPMLARLQATLGPQIGGETGAVGAMVGVYRRGRFAYLPLGEVRAEPKRRPTSGRCMRSARSPRRSPACCWRWRSCAGR